MIFQFISLGVAGAVKEKPKGLSGRSWMGGPAGASRNTFLFVCVPKGTSAAGRREEGSHGGSKPWPGQPQH